jgi:hypothetical protein
VVPQGEHRRARALILKPVAQRLPKLEHALWGFCWPFRVETGHHALVRGLVEWRAARASPPCSMHDLAPSCLGLQPDRGPRAASQADLVDNPRASGARSA